MNDPRSTHMVEPQPQKEPSQWWLLVLCVGVGLVAGLGAIAFHVMLDVSTHFFLGRLAGYYPPAPAGESPLFTPGAGPPIRWVLFALPALGGLLSGIIVYLWAPEAAGHGTDAAIEAYHWREGRVRARVPFIKALTSAITMGTGGSAGREGPIAQIGAGLGSWMAKKLGLSPAQRRTLMVAGLGGGVGAIFSAPLAGALFAAEVLYRDLDLEYEVIVPSVISSAVAYSVFGLWFGWDPIFLTPDFAFGHPAELLPYSLLALVAAGGAILFIKLFYWLHDGFIRLPIPAYLKPAVGGLVVGAIGLAAPQALATSFGALQQAISMDGSATVLGLGGVGALLVLAFAKMLTTSFSIGSGGSGGVFGPSVVIGGALGGAVGLVAAHLLPGMDIQPGAFVLVGMAAFFSAAANTPISTIIIVSEMSGNYHLLLPSMWACILAYLLARRHCLYRAQIRSRFEANLHVGKMLQGLLSNITVDQVLNDRTEPHVVQTVSLDTPSAKILQLAHVSQHRGFPVIDESGRLVGFVPERLLRRLLSNEDTFSALFVAVDLSVEPPTVTPADSLLTCMQTMAEAKQEELVVVEPDRPDKVIAVFSYADLVAAFNRRMGSEYSLPAQPPGTGTFPSGDREHADA